MHVYIACYSPHPPGGTDSRGEPFEDQTCQLVQCETNARGGQNAHQDAF